MSLSTPDLQLFGIDLRMLWRDMCRPWQEMHHWPLLAWLTPEVPIRLFQADGSQAVWLGNKTQIQAPNAKEASSGFVALELPEDQVLRRMVAMPAMSDAQIVEAAALEAQTISPFPKEDLVWGCRGRAQQSNQSEIEVVLASRRHVEQYLQTQVARLGVSVVPEIWALTGDGRPVVMAGFGEGARARHVRTWRRIGYVCLGLVACILVAILLTPTAQLRLRAIEAVSSYDSARARTQPLAHEREVLVKNAEQLAVVSEVLGARIDPLRVMDLLTQALPDDTSLLSLQIQGTKVTIAGQTINAAALMQHLSTQSGMRDVRAPTAATRPLGVTKESFTIEFTLDTKAVNGGGEPAAGSSTVAALSLAASAPVPVPSVSAASGAAVATPRKQSNSMTAKSTP